MKRERIADSHVSVKKIMAYMDFATQLKVAQERAKKERQKNSNK